MKNRFPLLLLLISLVKSNSYSQCTTNSIYFDGVYVNNSFSTLNDQVDISTNGPMSTIEEAVSYTIEAWVKRGHTTNPGGYERILSKDYIYQFRIINDQFVGEIGNFSVNTPYPKDLKWHHLAFVRDANEQLLKLFVYGELKATAFDGSTFIANNNAMVCIGARNNGNKEINELWKGYLRWLRVSKVLDIT